MYVQNDLMQRMLIKKCFLFTVGSVCHAKRYTTGIDKFLKVPSKVADDTRPDAEVAEKSQKTFMLRV
jgi:hypothetical protein